MAKLNSIKVEVVPEEECIVCARRNPESWSGDVLIHACRTHAEIINLAAKGLTEEASSE